ncbi:site-specific integrase [Alkaliphilus sp. MSJ-5]|uniref:Site-specific integrase n=1 Tax=Alkaliphilus flagellatus TaxID=2841507 RepID=A0ABS6G6I3_9FIRM|nr:site-specific integrase [Alkaliphilus flagellatus]MBU5676996.1 site-specific integrase [Alkaliphilus flagellatus]
MYISRIKSLFNKATKKPYKIIIKTPLDEDIDLLEEIKEAKALTKSELDNLLSLIKPEKDYVICLLAATCGLRIGEIIGLTWGDIDEVNSELNVNKQWKRLKNGSFGFGTVKRKNSNRIVPIPQSTLSTLLKYKKNNPTDIKNRIFLDNRPQNASYRIYKKLNKRGLSVTLHDLRHTYATMLVASGVDFKTVAKFMGHDVEMTIKTYSHVTKDMIKRATDTVNFIF